MLKKQAAMGRFYGIGVGPGDPELLTIKARRILMQVPLIFVPQSRASEESFAYSIIKGLVSGCNKTVVPLVFPMTRDRMKLKEAWNDAANQIQECLSKGRDCAFITEGDPLLYSTFIYIYEIFKEKYPGTAVEIIPGISSIFAAASRSGQTLVKGDESIAVVASLSDINRVKEIISIFDAIVFIKIDRSFGRLLELLEELDMTDKAVWIKRCTTSEEEIVRDIRLLKGKKLDYFSLLIVRK